MNKQKITVKILMEIQDSSIFTYTSITDFIEDKVNSVNNIKRVNIFIFENNIREACYFIMGFNITKEYITHTAIEFLENYLRSDN